MNENLKPKVIFVPFYAQCPQHRYAASARIRAEWPAKYLGADIITPTMTARELLEYDVVIFQKCFNRKFKEIAEELKRKKPGIKLGFDLCDAEWTNRAVEIKNMIQAVDFVTVSTEKIKEFVNDAFLNQPCHVIPDGHDLDYYKTEERQKEDSAVHYVWYGNSGTIKSLQAIMPVLERWSTKDDTLTIIADPLASTYIPISKKISIKFIPWKLETVNGEVARCNVALNPRLNTRAYEVKSNNKTVMAYILGLPCIDLPVDNEDEWAKELIRMRVPGNRKEDVKAKRQAFIEDYRMEKIAEIWEKVLATELNK